MPRGFGGYGYGLTWEGYRWYRGSYPRCGGFRRVTGTLAESGIDDRPFSQPNGDASLLTGLDQNRLPTILSRIASILIARLTRVTKKVVNHATSMLFFQVLNRACAAHQWERSTSSQYDSVTPTSAFGPFFLLQSLRLTLQL